MTVQRKDWLKKNSIPLTILGASVAIFVSITGLVTKYNRDIEERVRWEVKIEEAIKEAVKHKEDEMVHMPFKEKIEIFVTQKQHNYQYEIIFKKLDEMHLEIKELR